MPEIRGGVFEVCLFKRSQEGVRYLLLQRSESERLYPMMWQVVTGTLHDGEHAVTGALREIREETALEAEQFWVVPHVNTLYVARSDRILLSPFFAASVSVQSEPVLSAEHRDYRWTTLEEALALIPWPGQRAGVELVHRFIASDPEGAPLSRLSERDLEERRPS
jgi:dATP pyrophosphohydrolase